MDEYSITWGIEVDADSPRDAARKALEALTSDDPGSLAHVFLVDGPDGRVTIDLSPGAGTEDADLSTDVCQHCGRHIEKQDGRWVDPEATGDDSVWRETCDANHEDRIAAHEPAMDAPDIAAKDAEDDALRVVRSDTGETVAVLGPRYVQQDYAPDEIPGRVVADMLTRDDASADEIAGAAVEAFRRQGGLRAHLIWQAADLLEPGEVHISPEYLRGMVELIMYSCGGLSQEPDNDRAEITRAIEAEVTRQHAR